MLLSLAPDTADRSPHRALARAGRTVCLLERGREFQPGEYPATLLEGVKRNSIQHRRRSDRIAARIVRVAPINDDMNALVGCGLGGTSLINANVALEPEPRLRGPIRGGRRRSATDREGGIADGFIAARGRCLNPQPLPPDFPHLPKLQALQDSATALGMASKFYRPPINVTFEDGVNAAGVAQKRCIGCGDCVSAAAIIGRRTRH